GCGPVGSATPPGRPHRRRRARRGCCGDARGAAGLRRDRVLVPGVCFRDRVANGALPTTVDFGDADGQGSTRPNVAENDWFPRRASVPARVGTTRTVRAVLTSMCGDRLPESFPVFGSTGRPASGVVRAPAAAVPLRTGLCDLDVRTGRALSLGLIVIDPAKSTN